jgi:hypothetical protein
MASLFSVFWGFLKTFLLAYISCAGVSLWHFHIRLQHTLVRFTSPSFSLLPPPLRYLKQFQQVSLFCFHTCIWTTLTILTLLHPLSPTHPTIRTCFNSCPSLFRCMFVVQKDVAMVFHLWIYCTLIRLTTPHSFRLSPNNFLFFFFFFKCSPGWPRTRRDPPASTSWPHWLPV